MTDLTTISFAVPTRHALEFQTRAFSILAELTGGSAPPLAAAADARPSEFVPRDSKDVPGDVWDLAPWRDSDSDRATWIAASLPAHPRTALTYLCRNADRWVTGEQLAAELGLEHGAKSVPPSFKSMANRCRRAERRPMWEYDPQNGYRVPARIAKLFLPELAELGDR
jgi:hypothetical protein